MDLRVALVRHGETDWNVNLRYQGQQDTSLNDRGIRQASALGRLMASWPVLAVFSSDLKRARMTAEHIAAPHGQPVNLDPGLREMAFGEWEGLTAAEIQARWPDAYARWLDDPVSTSPQNGENLAELAGRAMAAVHGIISGVISRGTAPLDMARKGTACGEAGASARIPCIVVVSHGGPIRAILCSVRGLPLRTGFWNMGASPGSYAVLRATIETCAGRSACGCGRGQALSIGLTVERMDVTPAATPT